MDLEEQFDEIAQHTCNAAAKVKCSPMEYREGLLYIIGELQTAVQASKETDPD